MICNNCNKQNKEGNKFCEYCGNRLDIANVNNQKTCANVQTNKSNYSYLSWLTLGFLCFSAVMLIPIVLSLYDIISINTVPFIIILSLSLISSLVLSIISRVKNRDSMSLVLMILSIVFISSVFALTIILNAISIFCSCDRAVKDMCDYATSPSCG